MAQWLIPQDLHQRITSGPLCPFIEHACGSLDGQVPRYDDSHACVRCVAALTEGRLELSVRRIHPQLRRRFLEFWSFVDIDHPDDCWEWQGQRYADGSSTYFPFPRFWGRGRQYSAPRVATWLTWGDIGRLPLKHTCGNHLCCNPLHIRVRGVPHFHHNRRLASIELTTSAQRLLQDTGEFLSITRERAPGRYRRLERMGAEWIRLRAETGTAPMHLHPSRRNPADGQPEPDS
jgi:hypothetical protein